MIAISSIVANVLMTQPIALTFISFELSQKEKGKVALAWEIASDENLENIDIQRNADGKIWYSIGNVASARRRTLKIYGIMPA